MKIKVDLVKNVIFSFLSNASNIFLLVLLIMAGRFIGVEEFGKFTFAMALVGSFALFADFGITELTKRSVAREPQLAGKYLGNILVWKLVLSSTVLVLIVLTINVLDYGADVKILVYLLGLAALAKTFKTTALTFCQAFERFDLYALLHIGHNVSLLIFGTIALVTGMGAIGLGLVFVAVKLVDLIVAYWAIARKIVKIRLNFDRKFIRKLQMTAIPLGAYVVIQEVYWYSDTIMLSIMVNHEEVGLYNAAYRLFDGLLIIPLILSHAISPQLSRLFPIDRGRHAILVKRMIKYAIIISAIVTACGIVFSSQMILLLFGSQYSSAATGLQILVAGFLVVFLNVTIFTILISVDRQKLLLPLGLTGLVSNVAINLALIPSYGFIGAAIATLCSEVLVFFIGYYLLAKEIRRFPLVRFSLRPLLALAAIGGAWMLSGVTPQLFQLIFIIPLYAILLLVLKTFDKQELGAIRKMLRVGCA